MPEFTAPRATTSLKGTLPELLVAAAQRVPGRGFRVFDARGRTSEFRAYPKMLESVQAAAGRLAASGIQPGDRVLVCLPTSWAWLDTWLGCVWLGAYPVALAPLGNMAAAETYLHKAEGVAERIGATRLVCDLSLRQEAMKGGATRLAALTLTPEELAALSAAPIGRHRNASEDGIAFLQLTSGSTGLQRAVTISHRAAVHNPQTMDEAARVALPPGMRDAIRGVAAWLPLYHDMGLIGGVVYCMLNGYDLVLLRPETFLGRPRLWFETLAAFPGLLSPAPNFAYQACVERLDPAELRGVDLSGWLGAMTGAEMIRPETCAAFVEKFAGLGFRAEAFRPCYGLAEATLAVTVDRRGLGVRTAPLPAGADTGLGLREAVSTGAPVQDAELRIAAPDGSALPTGAIGQVRVKSPSLFSGYYNDPAATSEALQDGWLCTGDLGFIEDGELYLTGRTKDLLIVHGHNFMPHELEWQAEAITGGGGAARAAAFSVARGTSGEEAVLVVELDGRDVTGLAQLEHEIRARVGRVLGLPLADLAFVRRGSIPKTTSGKIQRGELRQRYLEGRLERITPQT